MKKAFLILLAFSLYINVYSQFDKNKISFSIGPSFPLGEFGNKDITNYNSGNADNGINLYLYYCHNFSRYLSLGTKIYYNSNKNYTEAKINKLNYSTGTTWTTKSSFWTSEGILIGATAHIPRTKKFIIDIRFYGGYLFLKSPEYTLTNGTLSTSFESSSAKSLGYSLGAGFSYFINKKWDILLNIDYIGTNFIYEDLVTHYSTGLINHESNSRRTYDIVNATIGVGYNFTRIFK